MTNQDYMRPIREAADEIASDFADAFGGDNVRRVAMRETLIEFAGSILDAVRAESAAALREANLRAYKDEIARPLR